MREKREGLDEEKVRKTEERERRKRLDEERGRLDEERERERERVGKKRRCTRKIEMGLNEKEKEILKKEVDE